MFLDNEDSIPNHSIIVGSGMTHGIFALIAMFSIFVLIMKRSFRSLYAKPNLVLPLLFVTVDFFWNMWFSPPSSFRYNIPMDMVLILLIFCRNQKERNMKRILVLTPTLGTRSTLDLTIKNVRRFGQGKCHHVLVAPENAISRLKEKYYIDILQECADERGIYSALNHGFKTLLDGYDYLTFINDDDYWLSDFSSLIDSITTDVWDMVYARTCYVDEKGAFLTEQTSCPWFSWFGGLLKRKGIVMLTQQATIIKTSLFRQLAGFDTSISWLPIPNFWLEASMIPDLKVKYIDKVVAAYCVQEGQLSSDANLQQAENERLLKEYPNLQRASLSQYLIYRLYNWRIYFRRFFRGKMTNPMC